MHEFVAHGTNVNTVGIGPTSGSVLATGGDDKRCGVWRLGDGGDAACLATLSGASSAASCVAFYEDESKLACGSVGGTVRVHDLQGSGAARALAGHRNEVLSLHAHPFGDFLASGGADRTVRLWLFV